MKMYQWAPPIASNFDPDETVGWSRGLLKVFAKVSNDVTNLFLSITTDDAIVDPDSHDDDDSPFALVVYTWVSYTSFETILH